MSKEKYYLIEDYDCDGKSVTEYNTIEEVNKSLMWESDLSDIEVIRGVKMNIVSRVSVEEQGEEVLLITQPIK